MRPKWRPYLELHQGLRLRTPLLCLPKLYDHCWRPAPPPPSGRRPAPCRRRVPDLKVAVRYGACGWTRTSALQVRNLVLYPSKLRPQLMLLARLERASSVIRRLAVPRPAKTPPPRSRSVWPGCPVLCQIKLQDQMVHAAGSAPATFCISDRCATCCATRGWWRWRHCSRVRNSVCFRSTTLSPQTVRLPGRSRYAAVVHATTSKLCIPKVSSQLAGVRRPPSPLIPSGQR